MAVSTMKARCPSCGKKRLRAPEDGMPAPEDLICVPCRQDDAKPRWLRGHGPDVDWEWPQDYWLKPRQELPF